MRKVILNVAVSLDGYIEGPNGEYDWCFTDDDYGMTEFLAQTDTIFFGRKSYELLVSSYPDNWNDKNQYVFSTTLQHIEPPAILVSNNVREFVRELKAGVGQDIWLFGGASLTHAFLQLGLVDQLLLAIHPLILGNGKSLFSTGLNRTWLQLLESKSHKSGLVQHRYEIKH